MQIKVIQQESHQLRSKPHDETKLGFGNYFTDHIFIVDYDADKGGWHSARIQPNRPLLIDPAAMGIHYGQELFEGMKAFYGKNGEILTFRAADNFIRLNKTASRLCMPNVDPIWALAGLRKLLQIDRDWVPKSKGTAVYIRPTMFATEPCLGVRAAKQYVFFILLCPVGAYYPTGFNPIKIHVEDHYVRAVVGGTGDVKAGGNYAGSMLVAENAKALGCSQVLWLDAIEHKYAEEVGAMNVFFVFGNEVVTPKLTGSILPGITRDSIIKMLRDWGINVQERSISIDEIVRATKSGHLTEIFNTGTAAVISPVGEFHYKNEHYVVGNNQVGAFTQKLYDNLLGIQTGEIAEEYGWVEKI